MLRGVARSLPRGLALLVTITATETPPREHGPGPDLGYVLLIAVGLLALAAGLLVKEETLRRRSGAASQPEWRRIPVRS